MATSGGQPTLTGPSSVRLQDGAGAALVSVGIDGAAPATPTMQLVGGIDSGGTLLKRLQMVNAGADAQGEASNMLGIWAAQRAYQGVSWDRLRTPNVFKPQSAVSIAAEATIWTPASGKKFRLMGVYLQQSVAGNITLRDNTAGTIICVVPSGAAGDAALILLGNGIMSAAANNVLTATGAAASTLSGIVFGTEE